MEFERCAPMGDQIREAVPSGVKMELVGNFERSERLVQFARAPVEAVPVFRAAIEINLSSRKRGGVLPKIAAGKFPPDAPAATPRGGTRIRAALCALTEPNSSGLAKAIRSARIRPSKNR